MSDGVLKNGMQTLSRLLYKHYGQKVIVLIDEYDVPLDKAEENGYYDQMALFIRNMFSNVLKTNDSLYFAVLTGCLRISKESIFTGLNNLKILSITNVRFDEHFGFQDREVQALLAAYGLSDKHELVKQWYDGYQFGRTDVYCPWDVLNYVDEARSDEEAEPQAYWLNTSENRILRRFLHMATPDTMEEIDTLINGGCVRKKIVQELTYKELYEKLDNIWSVLFTTGYLTQKGKPSGDLYQIAIPNLEVKKIFVDRIREWFFEESGRDSRKLSEFCEAFLKPDVEAIQERLNEYLKTTIGIHDYSIRNMLKENYYHGLLVGLLKHYDGWSVTSNEEAGDGYSDILIKSQRRKTGIIIEVKYSREGGMELDCEKALQQIEAGHYARKLAADGMTRILSFGIAFCKKDCRVLGGAGEVH